MSRVGRVRGRGCTPAKVVAAGQMGRHVPRRESAGRGFMPWVVDHRGYCVMTPVASRSEEWLGITGCDRRVSRDMRRRQVVRRGW